MTYMAVYDGHLFKGSNFDDIFRDLLWSLGMHPQYVPSPRGSLIKENLAVTLVLSNPRARLISSRKRLTNYGFGVGEFVWYWNAKSDLETMLYYNKRMKEFSDDGRTLNSAYGWRLLRALPHGQDMDQWTVAKETLRQDPDSRRCILHINSPNDQYIAVTKGSKDVPCTLSLQFFIRNGCLDLHTHMRSNDVMWGLTYDLFSFTLLQECMFLDLSADEKFKDLKLGKYYHTAGSMHLYEKHFTQAEEIVREYGTHVNYLPPMDPITSLRDLDLLCKAERELRLSECKEIHGFHGAEKWMGEQLNLHRQKRDEEAQQKS